MKRVSIVVVLAVLLMLVMPLAVNAADGIKVEAKSGDGVWVDDTWQVEMFPGEMRSTTLTLYNSASSSLNVEIPLPDSIDNGNLMFELDKTSFTMPGRSYIDVILTLRASGEATPGTYTIELLEIRSEAPLPGFGPSAPIPVVPQPEEEPDIVEPTSPESEEPLPEVPTEPEEPVEELEESKVEEPVEEEFEMEESEVFEEPEPILEPVRSWSWLFGVVIGGIFAIMMVIIYWKSRRNIKEKE